MEATKFNIVKVLVAWGFWICFFPSLDAAVWQGHAYAEEPKTSVVERQYSILKLTNTQDPTVAKSILHALKDPDPLVRYTAVWRIGRSHATHLNVRVEGMSSLDVSQSPEIIQAFFSGLSDQDSWVRTQLIKTLPMIAIKGSGNLLLRQKIKQDLLTQLSDIDPYIRTAAIRALGTWLADGDVNTALKRALVDDASMIREAIFWVRYGDFDALAQAIRDESPEIRVTAVEFLAAWNLNNPRTIDLLTERLRDPNDNVVQQAIQAARRSSSPKMVKPLLSLLMDNKFWKDETQDKIWEQEIQTIVEEITGKKLDEVLKEYPPLQPLKRDAPIRQIDVRGQIEKLKKGEEPARLSAVIALTWSEASEAVDALVQTLTDPAPRVRYAAADALAGNHSSQYRRTDSVVGALLKATADPNPHVRRSVVAGLHHLSYEENYRSRIISQLSDLASRERDPFVRLEIISALDPSATNISESPAELIEKKRSGMILANFIRDEFPGIRSWVIGSVDLSCHPDLIGQIFASLDDPIPSVRSNAIRNLSDNADILGRTDRERLKEKLNELAKNDLSENVRETAVRGLETVDSRSSRPKLNLLENQALAGCRNTVSLR